MKHLSYFVVFWIFCFVLPTKATLLHLDAQATMTEGMTFPLMFIPIGTTVATSLDFDQTPGPPNPRQPISSGTGWFRWNMNGAPMELTVDSMKWESRSYSTFVFLQCAGTGPSEGDVRLSGFSIYIDIGVLPWETSMELSDLLAGGTITKIRAFAGTPNWGQSSELEADVSGNIYIVPEPATVSLLALGSLALLRKRKYQ